MPAKHLFHSCLLRGTFPLNAVRATLDDTRGRTTNAEARLTSKTSVSNGDRFEWIVGSMYMDDYVYEQARLFENVDNRVVLKEHALFGQASFVPFANVNFTGGYRHTWDEKSFYGSQESLDSYADSSAADCSSMVQPTVMIITTIMNGLLFTGV